MPKLLQFEPNQQIEDWIKRSTIKPHPSEFKVTTASGSRMVQGLNYGCFGVHNTGTGFRVTHLKSGWACGPEFEEKKQADRYVFMLLNFENWDRLVVPNTIPKELMQHCHTYCQEMPLGTKELAMVLAKVGNFALFSPERAAASKKHHKPTVTKTVVPIAQPRHQGPLDFGENL